jgi:hypothetical protein
MGDHVVVNVDGLVSAKDDGVAAKPSEAVTGASVAVSTVVDLAQEDAGEDEPLIQAAECRICQEEDSIKNLEKPCTCNGSLKVRLLFSSYFQIFNLVLMPLELLQGILLFRLSSILILACVHSHLMCGIPDWTTQ